MQILSFLVLSTIILFLCIVSVESKLDQYALQAKKENDEDDEESLPRQQHFQPPISLPLVHYVVIEAAKRAETDIRREILTNLVLQERLIVCMAPFLCNMKGEDQFYNPKKGHCAKFNIFQKARRFFLSGILKKFNITITGKPMDGMPQLYDYCGVKTPISEYFRLRSSLLGNEITRFGPSLEYLKAP